MKTYTLPCLEALDWDKAEVQHIEQCSWSPNAAPAATVQGIYLKGKALVFRIASSAAPSRRENTEPDSAVWEDSCLECFFSFDSSSYVNLEANANAALRASFGPGRHGRKFLKDMDITMPDVKVLESDKGWEVTFSITVDMVQALWGVKAESGCRFSANFYSCGDKTPAPHFAAWNKVQTESPDFHRPEFFGEIIIG